MDISKAKKLVELTKGDRKILVTVYEGGQVSSCITEEPPPTSSLEFPPPAAKQYCETCQCNDETCQEYIEHLKGKGYQATEIELADLGLEESLPKFLEEREVSVKVHPVFEVKAHPVISVKAQPVVETEVNEHADIGTVEAVLGSPGELQPGESGGGSPETS